MIGEKTNGILGDVNVVVTNNRGHSIDTLSSMCVDKIVSVSNDAPTHVRLQAGAYKDTIRQIVREYLLHAKMSERTTIIGKLDKAGVQNAASIIGAL